MPVQVFPTPPLASLMADVSEQLRITSELNLSIIREAAIGAITAQNILNQYSLAYLDSFEAIKASINQSLGNVRDLAEGLEQEGIDAKEISQYFEEAGLWLSSSMPLAVWYGILESYHRNELTSANLLQLVMDQLEANNYELVKEMAESWFDRKEFQSRERFIRDACEAHFQGKYTLSVPVFLLVSEGIIRDIYAGSFPSHKFGKELKKRYEDVPLKHVSTLLFADLFDDVFIRSIPEKDDLKQYDELFNRHVILHGRDLTYDTKINSVRGFLLLDELTEILDDGDL